MFKQIGTLATRSSDFAHHSNDYKPNWTPLSPILTGSPHSQTPLLPLRSHFFPISTLLYTAISINVVGLNLQTCKSRPNGAMGIYCNLHITIEEIYKFVFLHVEYFVFLSVKPFLYLFFRRYVVWIILFK